MKRLRTLGMTAILALALTATIGAASASATAFRTDTYPAYVSGTPAGSFILTTNAVSASCNGFTFSAYYESVMQGEQLNAALANDSCQGATFKPNGCEFIYHPGSETSPKHFKGTFDIGPAGCGPMSVTVFGCKLTYGAQSGLFASYEDLGEGATAKVLITAGATGVKYTQESVGSPGCTNGTYSNGTYTGSWEAKAKNLAGASTGLQVVNQSPNHIWVAGTEAEEESKQPKIEAEEYPIQLTGEQEKEWNNTFGFNAGKVNCTTATLTAELSKATSELAFVPVYKGACYFNQNQVAVIKLNGCKYVFHVKNAGPPYTGTVDVTCPEGKEIEISKITFGWVTQCTVTVKAQSGLSGVTYTNGADGKSIKVGLNLSGIKYHQQAGEGSGACETGDFESGTYSGTTNLRRTG